MRDEGRSILSQQVPRALTREGRIELLAETASALLRGELPSKEAAMFTGSALLAWLQTGNTSFEKHTRVGAPRGSHHKHSVLYARLLIADERNLATDSLESVELNHEQEFST